MPRQGEAVARRPPSRKHKQRRQMRLKGPLPRLKPQRKQERPRPRPPHSRPNKPQPQSRRLPSQQELSQLLKPYKSQRSQRS